MSVHLISLFYISIKSGLLIASCPKISHIFNIPNFILVHPSQVLGSAEHLLPDVRLYLLLIALLVGQLRVIFDCHGGSVVYLCLIEVLIRCTLQEEL